VAVFLLWNIQRKAALDNLVAALVQQLNVDVLLLVEYPFGRSALPVMLYPGHIQWPSSEKFGVFTRSTHILKRLKYRLGSRACMWKWTPPNQDREGNLVLLHGYDRRNYDDSTRRQFFQRISQAIQRREEVRKHKRTIVAGDFNSNPFDPSMVDSDGMHAIGLRAVRSLQTRRITGLGKHADFFYNPMWRLYGQQTSRDAGSATHYWVKERTHELGWHMLDQVVLRPTEAQRFPEDRLRIITQVRGISLLGTDGLPDQQTGSDHLPLTFEWNL
jgi:endonuclease/exonuclease/phosphatase (EEP) superfamily protein YafD